MALKPEGLILLKFSILFVCIFVLLPASSVTAQGQVGEARRGSYWSTTHGYTLGKFDANDNVRGNTSTPQYQAIKSLLNTVFKRKMSPTQCIKNAENRLMARDCLIGLIHWLHKSHILTDCNFYQGQYDCLGLALRGCYDRDGVLQKCHEMIQRSANEHTSNCQVVAGARIDVNRHSNGRRRHEQRSQTRRRGRRLKLGSTKHDLNSTLNDFQRLMSMTVTAPDNNPEADITSKTMTNSNHVKLLENSNDNNNGVLKDLSRAGVFASLWLLSP